MLRVSYELALGMEAYECSKIIKLQAVQGKLIFYLDKSKQGRIGHNRYTLVQFIHGGEKNGFYSKLTKSD